MTKEQLLAEIKRTVLHQSPDAEIILYGSFARGDQKHDADIDLLILLGNETITREDEKKISHSLYCLELDAGQVISPLIKSKKLWYEKYPNTGLCIHIQKEGVVI